MTEQTTIKSESLDKAIEKKAVAPEKAADTVGNLIDRLKPQITKALPSQVSADRFLRVCMTTLRTSGKLVKCDPQSLMAALLTAAQLGLEPSILGQCYLIPYGNKVEFQIGYKGMIDLARRSGELQTIYASIFYKEEIEAGRFDYSEGTDLFIRHKPMIDLVDPMPVGAYAVARFKDGGFQFVVMGKHVIEKIKASSKTNKYPDSPWNKWPEEMWKKTAIRRLFKMLPISVELASKVMDNDQVIKSEVRDDMTEPGLDDAINVDFSVGG